MRLTTGFAAIVALALPGCATLLDSMTSLDETTASQLELLDEVRGALTGTDGSTLPDQLAQTQAAVFRLAGEGDGRRSLADLASALDQTNETINGVSQILEGVLENTESLVWPAGELPPGETEGGSILGGVYTSTSRLSGLIPERPTLMLLAGAALGVLVTLLFGRGRG